MTEQRQRLAALLGTARRGLTGVLDDSKPSQVVGSENYCHLATQYWAAV